MDPLSKLSTGDSLQHGFLSKERVTMLSARDKGVKS
jgi:hypothetical protein